MTTAEALAREWPPADARIAYGGGELQFGDLRLPTGEGPFPVALVIHGGCWLAAYDLAYMGGLAEALTGDGFATWSVEYRRVGDPGGGWPGTFEDVAAAADHLRSMARDHSLDLERVVAVGHSAGGHLALWLAARPGLPATDPLRGEAPLALRAAVALAGITDLAGYASDTGCGSAVPGLLGGSPRELPERLRRSSPVAMPAPEVPIRLVVGALDPIVPIDQAHRYTAGVGAAVAEVIEVPRSGHFELVNPDHEAWVQVRAAILAASGVRSAHTEDPTGP